MTTNATPGMTLEEAHLELLDHVGENVHAGIMLPGDVPWSGTYGVLSHQAHRVMGELREQSPEAIEGALRVKRDWSGSFMVGDFVLPLDATHVLAVRRKEDEDGEQHPGLDFTVGTENKPAVRVRVSYVVTDGGEQ